MAFQSCPTVGGRKEVNTRQSKAIPKATLSPFFRHGDGDWNSMPNARETILNRRVGVRENVFNLDHGRSIGPATSPTLCALDESPCPDNVLSTVLADVSWSGARNQPCPCM